MTTLPHTEGKLVVSTAAALIIGAELLSGKVRDENLYALSKTLRAIGIELKKVVICADDQNTIAEELRAAMDQFDVVFTSGGVGPTHDDVTIEGVSLALGTETEHSLELEAMLRKAYGEKTTETHLRMARLPRGAYLADGADIVWPIIVAQNIWILPGVPELFRMKLLVVRARLCGPEPFFTEQVYCTWEEAEIKPLLDELVSAHPRVEIGSYPKWFDKRYKTRVTFDGRDRESTAAAARAARSLLANCVVTID